MYNFYVKGTAVKKKMTDEHKRNNFRKSLMSNQELDSDGKSLNERALIWIK